MVKGASVGSMTAALVAGGITPEDFTRATNDPQTSATVLQGRDSGLTAAAHGYMGNKISGKGLREVVLTHMNAAIRKQIDKYMRSPPETRGTEVGAQMEKILAKVKDDKWGVTFNDLRILHQAIPDIKEVEISATMIGDDLPPEKPGKAKPEGKARLAMFTADTQPFMEVALACQASAALPPVFEPVEIKLEQGFTGKFIDGGVLSNAPSAKTVQATREVDPIPPRSGMTFVFQGEQGEDEKILSGTPQPVKNEKLDNLTQAPNSVAEYALARTLADRRRRSWWCP